MLISLIGYRGTGKTTVGQLLADRLGWTCIDTDFEVEQQTGVSIKQLFELEGESGFRDRESEVIRVATRRFKSVLSLGGGAILRDQNRQAISVAGPVVWLNASAKELYRRISDDPLSVQQRPNLTSDGGFQEIQTVLAQRIPIYQACSDCQIDTEGKTPRQITDEIISKLDLTPQDGIS